MKAGVGFSSDRVVAGPRYTSEVTAAGGEDIACSEGWNLQTRCTVTCRRGNGARRLSAGYRLRD